MIKFIERRLTAFAESVLALLKLNLEVFICEFFLEGGWTVAAIIAALIHFL